MSTEGFMDNVPETAKPLDEVVPEWGEQAFVSADNEFMQLALQRCEEMHQRHPEVSNPTAAAVVKEGKLLALENGGQIHETFCPRVALQSKSGEEYDYCPDHCHPRNHAESSVAKVIKEQGVDVTGGELYLGGHYWACMPCWEAMKSIGITKLRLVEDAVERYKKKRGAAMNPRAGMLPRAMKVAVIGSFDDNDALIAALKRVGFEVVASDAQATDTPEVFLLGPNSPAAETYSGSPQRLVVDARSAEGYRLALTQLSRELEPLFK